MSLRNAYETRDRNAVHMHCVASSASNPMQVFSGTDLLQWAHGHRVSRERMLGKRRRRHESSDVSAWSLLRVLA